MAIITITRRAGSLGDEIGMLLARRLGYTFYGKKEIEKRIIAKGLPREEFMKFDERKPRFLDRFTKNRNKYLSYLSSVILEMASEGNCVIVGRGAFLLLRDVPNHITLCFVAPHDFRLKHIKDMTGITTDKIAEKLLANADRQQEQFYRSCFNYDILDHSAIHATINTALSNADLTAEMIIAGIKNNFTPEVEAMGKKRIEELVLAQQMAGKLIFDNGLHIDDLWVVVRDDTVTLHGMTSFHATVERAIMILESEYSGYKVVSKIKSVQDNRFCRA